MFEFIERLLGVKCVCDFCGETFIFPRFTSKMLCHNGKHRFFRG